MAAPSIHYVDPTGIGGPPSDAYTATQAQNKATPWATIDRALKAAPAFALVFLRAGTYARYGNSVSTSLQRAHRVDIAPYPPERKQVLFQGIDLSQVRQIRFHGLTVVCQGLSEINICENISIVGCNWSKRQLKITQCKWTRIESNEWHDILTDSPAAEWTGIAMGGTSTGFRHSAVVELHIRRNVLYGFGGDAIQLSSIRFCQVVGNDTGRTAGVEGFHGDGFQIVSGKHIYVADNIWHDGVLHPFIITPLSLGTENIWVVNNIGLDAVQIAFDLSGATSVRVLHNLATGGPNIALYPRDRTISGNTFPSEGVVVANNITDSIGNVGTTRIVFEGGNYVLEPESNYLNYAQSDILGIKNPTVPSCSIVGTAGTTDYEYAVVVYDGGGNRSAQSDSTLVPNAPDTLSSTNKVRVALTASSPTATYDVLKLVGDEWMRIGGGAHGANVDDSGQTPTAYTPAPSFNETWPQFTDFDGEDFTTPPGDPARQAGIPHSQLPQVGVWPRKDRNGTPYAALPDMGPVQN